MLDHRSEKGGKKAGAQHEGHSVMLTQGICICCIGQLFNLFPLMNEQTNASIQDICRSSSFHLDHP
jgi:amino acid permease